MNILPQIGAPQHRLLLVCGIICWDVLDYLQVFNHLENLKGNFTVKINVHVLNSMHVAAMIETCIDGDDVEKAMALADELHVCKCPLGEYSVIKKEHLGLSGDHYFHAVVALGLLADERTI